MARRRRLAGAANGAANAITDVLGMLLQNRITSERASEGRAEAFGYDQLGRTEADRIQRERTASEKVASGEWSPDQASAFKRGGDVPEPNVSTRLADLLKTTTDAPNAAQVPTPGAIDETFKAKRVPLVGFGQTAQNTGDEATLPSTQFGPTLSPERASFDTVRNEKLRAFPLEKIGTEMQGSGDASQPVDIFGKYNVDTGQQERTSTQPAGPTAGQTASAKLAEVLGNELSPARTAASVTAQNTIETGTRKEKVRTAGQTTSAQATASRQAETAEELRRLGLGMLPQQEQTAAMQLADDFANQSTEFYTVQQQFRNISEYAQNPSPAGDMGIIFSWMKMVDPRSSVREGERADASNAASVPERVRTWYNKLIDGKALGPADGYQRNDIVSQAANTYRSFTTEHQRRVQDFAARGATLAPHVPSTVITRDPSPDLLQQSLSPLEQLRQRGQGAR